MEVSTNKPENRTWKFQPQNQEIGPGSFHIKIGHRTWKIQPLNQEIGHGSFNHKTRKQDLKVSTLKQEIGPESFHIKIGIGPGSFHHKARKRTRKVPPLNQEIGPGRNGLSCEQIDRLRLVCKFLSCPCNTFRFISIKFSFILYRVYQ